LVYLSLDYDENTHQLDIYYLLWQGLLSKTIPKSLAKGVLNAGLLATEAGTSGRVLGDVWFSRATFMGLDQMLNRTFVPMCAMVGLAIVAALASYPYLQPNFQADSEDEDDEDD
jgi:hypothetical protein